MWRWWLLVLLWGDAISSQPVSEEKALTECCPCPKPDLQTLESNAAPIFQDQARSALPDATSSCRSPDSEGAPSIFLPRAFQPQQRVLPQDSKEDQKPLLHPEVEFATSFLDTLREATDEEYQDAVARDAAKSATKTSEASLRSSGDSKKLVTIIVNNDEEDPLIPEASNIQESRCAASEHVGSARIFERKPLLGLSQKPLKLFDMDNGASNRNEAVTSIDRLDNTKLKTPSLLRFFPSRSSNTVKNSNVKDVLKIGNLGTPFRANDDVGDKFKTFGKNIPKLRLSAGLIKPKTEIKITSNRDELRSTDKNGEIDFDTAPSNVEEQVLQPKDAFQGLKLRPFNKIKDFRSSPLQLNNILKLKDVELIIPKQNKVKITIPKLKLQPVKSSQIKSKEDSTAQNTVLKSNTENCKEKDAGIDSSGNEVQDEHLNTEIIDALPSPSQTQVIVDDSTKTMILDSVPKHEGSEVDDMEGINNQEILSDTQNNIENLNTNSDNNIPVRKSKQQDDLFKTQLQNNNVDSSIFIEDGNSDTVILIDNERMNPAYDAAYVDADEFSNMRFSDDPSEYQDSEETVLIIPEDAFNDFDDIIDSDVDTTNTMIQIAPNDHSTEEFEVPFNRENPDSEEMTSNENFTTKKPPTPASQVIQNLKQRMSDRFNQFKQTLASSNESEPKNIAKDDEIMQNDESSDELATSSISQSSPKAESNDCDGTAAVNMEQLENLSNSLLNLSNKKNENFSQTSEELEPKSNENDIEDSGEDNVSNNTNVDSDENSENSNDEPTTSATTTVMSIFKDLIQNGNTNEFSDEASDSDLDNTSIEEERSEDTNAREDNTCPSLETKQNIQDIDTSDQDMENEMSVEASAPAPSILSQSSPLDGLVVEPSSLFPNNLFNRPLPSISNLIDSNSNIPTLDDIRSGINNILGLNARNKDDNSDEDEFESAEDCSDTNPGMATAASNTRSNPVSPLLTPFQDLNFDIFQVRPLSQSKMPGLDLNTFKTRLAIPQYLDLKPVKLQSSLGKKDGLLGATLTFGPEKLDSSKSSSNFGRIPPVLASPLKGIPSLDDIRETVRANAESLLNSSPLPSLRSSLLTNTPSLETIHNNLRSHTENTVKNLQQTLASTLQESQVRQEKLAQPQDLLEDMNDKLHAIHLDLNDRLSTIHEKIFDPSKLAAIHKPLFTDSRNNKPQSKSTSSLRSSPTTSRGFRVPPPSSQRSSQNRQNNVKPFKISKAVTAITPKTVDVPKLISTSTNAPFSKPLQRDSRLQLKEKKPEPERTRTGQGHRNRPGTPASHIGKPSKGLSRYESPISGNNRKLFGDSHGFASETNPTRVPFSESRRKPQFSSFGSRNAQTTGAVSTKPKPPLLNQSPTSSQAGVIKPKDHKLTEGTDTGAENPSSRAFLARSRTSPIPTTGIQRQHYRPNSKAPSTTFPLEVPTRKIPTIPNPSVPRRPLILDPKSALESKPIKDSVVWPRQIDNDFINRVRDGIRSRLANINPQSATKTNPNIPNNNDMTKAASESRYISTDGPNLKENVSYKCKLVCVRDPEK